MFKARVVLPAIAILIPPTQAQEREEPVKVVLPARMGPAPPAVWTDHPSREKAATIAHMDLMKNNHRIFRGWIMTKGNWTEGRLALSETREKAY